MSTSLLYHAFGVHGYIQKSIEFVACSIVFHVEQERGFRCAACKSWQVICRGTIERRFRSVPIARKPSWIVLPVQRVECLQCAVLRQVEVDFADARRTYTKEFERYALELCRICTIKDVARYLGVSWDLIKDIDKRYYRRVFAKPPLKHLRFLAIDEICIGKGYRFLTIVMDLETGAVVFVGQGKGADALAPFWKRLKVAGACIEAVAMDMSRAYIDAVTTNLPEAQIVFDHFHVIKLFNEKLSELRRDMYREATEQMKKDVLKGTRWLLLRNPENLNEAKNERQRLEEALRLNQPLAAVYYLKEDLRRFWCQEDKDAARDFLQDWIKRALASGIRILKQFAKTLAGKRSGLLAYYDFRISSGPLEGTNNKIKTMQRAAYGYRDQEYSVLKIYGLHKVKYALVG
jgi:transposase